MNPELNPMEPALEHSVSEIRDEGIDDAMVEAAAARVWQRLVAEGAEAHAGHIRSCEDFQALIPDYRSGQLPAARALLLKDHLNGCVACRHAYEGKVVAFPAPPAVKAASGPRPLRMYWAAAAVVLVAAGITSWYVIGQHSGASGRAYIKAVNGAIYEISATGVRPLQAGQDLADGVVIRTAKDSYATVQLRDGSTVEMRERSELSTSQSGNDLTVHLGRGDLVFEAAKRRTGHLYVATADCRVAVTGTVFSVNSGTKGSRVSVLQGEVHVSQDNQDKVLHPGDQSVTGLNLSPAPILYDISWSREIGRLNAPKAAAGPARVSPLLERVPANTVFIAILPNPAASLADSIGLIRQRAMQNPQLQELLAGRGLDLTAAFDKLRSAGEFVSEVAVVGLADAPGAEPSVALLASLKRPGFREFVAKAGLPLNVVEIPGFAVMGQQNKTVEAVARTLEGQQGAFRSSPCYDRMAEAMREGAATLACADLSRLHDAAAQNPAMDARYVLGAQRQVNGQDESRVTLGFNGPRTGIAAWLAPPAPMGSLDYLSPETTFAAAFVVNSPAAIIDQIVGLQQRSAAGAEKALDEARQRTGIDVRNDLAGALGGEFALAVDGPIIPTPSVKLIAEVYNPAKFQGTLQKVVVALNAEMAKRGSRPLRMSQETVEGRTYYMIGGADPNPLTEVHYTFADGYLIAGLGSNTPVEKALQVKKSRASISRSSNFIALIPRDHYANFSGVVYQNFGTTLAPIAGLLGAFAPQQVQQQMSGPLSKLGNMKSTFLAIYGEPDRITMAGGGNMLGIGLNNITGGSLLGIAGGAVPFGQFPGTRGRQPAFIH